MAARARIRSAFVRTVSLLCALLLTGSGGNDVDADLGRAGAVDDGARTPACKLVYPLELELQADTDPAIYYQVFDARRMLTVRRVNRDAIRALTIANSSAWEPVAVYPLGCRLWVEVSFNLHDTVP